MTESSSFCNSYFNPRSLTGATLQSLHGYICQCISIHAPLRERHRTAKVAPAWENDFNPRSLTGATEPMGQSTANPNFNPRSLTGATDTVLGDGWGTEISIHAPLRERLQRHQRAHEGRNFNPRSLTGATAILDCNRLAAKEFQSTLPYGSDSIKTKYFSIHLNQAFIANRLNSNPQRFYFDVRKLLISHSSSSCEPKLNFMFHITSHRIILHYFFSCQSICK